VRDTNNPYDPNAIKAALPSGETLGYLTREHAAFLVNHIGGKGCIPGRVLRIAQDKVYVAVVIGKRVNP
jgi:hypothetical protein